MDGIGNRLTGESDSRDNIKRYLAESFRPGSQLVGFVSFTTAIIGYGMLFLPGAAMHSGLILTLIQLIVGACISCYSDILLIKCAKKRLVCSYQELADETFGKPFRWLTNLTILLGNGGMMIFLFQTVSSLLEIFITSTTSDGNVVNWVDNQGKLIIPILFATLVVLPLCLPKYLKQLRYFWIFNLIFVLVICVVVIEQSIIYEDLDAHYMKQSYLSGLPKTFPPLIFALNHYNVLDVFGDLNAPSKQIMKKVVKHSMALVFLIYLLIIIFGYFTFSNPYLPKDYTKILFVYYSYNPKNGHPQAYPVQVIVCMLMVTLLLTWKLPVFVIPAKDGIRDFFYPRKSDPYGQPIDTVTSVYRHSMFIFITIFSCLVISILVPSTVAISNLCSSSFWIIHILVFPALFYLRLPARMQKRKHKIISTILLVTMTGFAVWFTYSNFRDLVSKSS